MDTKQGKKPIQWKILLNNLRYKLYGHHFVDGIVSRISIYIILIAISYVFLYPLLKMLSMSLMSAQDIVNPEIDWIPQHFSLSNFKVASFVLDMPKTLFNSIWYSGTLALFQTAVSALTAFAFARYNFKFKKFWFSMILLSFILPLPVVLIPRIMTFISIQTGTGIQLIGTIIPQLLMTLLGQGINSAILILILYNFFKMIPSALDEAAKIDGASSFQVFWHVILKLSIPTIVTVYLFSFVWNWNETYVTTTFLRSAVKLLPIQLVSFDSTFAQLGTNIPGQAGQALINEAYKMAATLISIAPLLLMYIFAQKQFIEGIESTGIK